MSQDEGANTNLKTPVVGSWAKTKYNIVRDYTSLFSSGMKKLWGQRIYIDLYSGAGQSVIEKTNEVVDASPLIALQVNDSFNKYIFCDNDEDNIDSLKIRTESFSKITDIQYVLGDCNEKIGEITSLIPEASKGNTVLTFCFVDPYSLCVEFETIKKLSAKFVDFLVLLAFGMDGKRNIQHYVKDNNKRIDNFLGLTDWRERWNKAQDDRVNLVKFLADEFTNQMVRLGYLEEAVDNFIPIRSDEKNLPLYYLAFYSRNKRGYDFWKKVKSRNTEKGLFD
ncbi:MAG: hypothetical protein A2V66_04040 [Ignavibacteria bacterium RBG_13_36_8]|nr:MAG: hypothetical protein A2V66_04040 [Ignavibacteria bacterium RBG_13_36_8]